MGETDESADLATDDGPVVAVGSVAGLLAGAVDPEGWAVGET